MWRRRRRSRRRGKKEKKRKKERKKEGEKAEGIILLICLDPVKLQIALNQCFMAVLQISFIYTLYMARQEGTTTFRFRKHSRPEYYFYRRAIKNWPPSRKIYSWMCARNVTCSRSRTISFFVRLIQWKLGRWPLGVVSRLIYYQIRM